MQTTDVLKTAEYARLRLPPLKAIVALAVLTFVAYIPAFRAGFVFDDHILIEKNPAIHELANMPRFFVSKEARIVKDFSDLQSDIYRPLQTVSYTFSYALWKNRAPFFHAENIILHLVNGLLVYIIVSSFFADRVRPFLASLLFLLHPVQVEAVTYISERANVLAVAFCLLSFLALIRSRHAGAANIWYAASLVLFAGSLLSKETTVIYPFIIMLYLALADKGKKSAASASSVIKTALPYIAILAGYLVIRTLNLGKIAQMEQRDLISVLATVPRVFFEYIKLIVWPARLTFFHDFDLVPPTSPAPVFISAVIITLLFLYLCLRAIRKDKVTAFFLISYLVALLPVSNIIAMKVVMQERFLYFPSAFLFTAISCAVVTVKEKGAIAKYSFLLFIGVVTVVLLALTFNRNLAWVDQNTLMSREKLMHSDRGIFDFDLGVDSFRQKRYDEAIGYLNGALQKRLSPIHAAMAYNTLGDCYRTKGDLPNAIRSYEGALSAVPDYVSSLNSIGHIYFGMGEYSKARDYFGKAVMRWPDSPVYNKNLGTAYIMLQDKESALKYWKRSLSLDANQPDVVRYINRNEQS